MSRARIGVAATLLFLLGGCGPSETGPVAGELAVRVTAPGSGARAISLRLVGPHTALRAAPTSPYRLFSVSLLGDTARIAVVAPRGSAIAAGELLRLAVPDVRQVGAYRATVTDVAGNDYALADAHAYALEVVRP